MLLVYADNAFSQSVKEIIGDKTGKYIYAQARDENPDSAFELASDELTSRVDAYIGANKLKKFNKNWREWIKRIVNEKYGLTRVFLYVSVSDLNEEAEKLTAAKSDYVGSAKEIAPEVEKVATPEAEIAIAQVVVQENPQAPIDSIAEETVIINTDNQASGDNDLVERHKNAFPKGTIYDIIQRIISNGKNGDIVAELSRGKNLRAISMYGNTNSKYLDHAFVVTDDNGTISVYSPKDDNGMRTDFRHGTSTAEPSGKMIYWFLKK